MLCLNSEKNLFYFCFCHCRKFTVLCDVVPCGVEIRQDLIKLRIVVRNLTLSLPECLMEFCKVTLTFGSVDEILWCDHSNQSSLPLRSHDAICFSQFWKMKFGNLFETCLWPHLAVKGLMNFQNLVSNNEAKNLLTELCIQFKQMLIKICKICLWSPGEKENKRRSSIKKKSAKSWGTFFNLLKVKACEGVCAMHSGLREKPVTGLAQTWKVLEF